MVDTAFNDFLDSDDDDFFLEASQKLLDYSTIESTQTPEKAVSQNEAKTSTSLCLKSDYSTTSGGTQNVFNTKETSSKEGEVAVNYNVKSTMSLESNTDDVSDYSNKTLAKECAYTNNHNLEESRILLELYSRNVLCSPQKECVTNISLASTSAECTSGNNLNEHPNPITPSYIDKRFIPGFTPKPKKLKLPGPAGLIDLFKEAAARSSNEMAFMDIDFEYFQNSVSSHFTPELLSLVSWRKLQTTVSSCPNLHSTVKHYSIKRVLKESSKKKLPKHMVVPVLCILLKTLCYEEPIRYEGSHTRSVFMDDTGEIIGKIDAEVLSTYKEYLVEGTALILKKVTILCNVLMLKAQNLVSVYHPDGMEKHPQTLDSILKNPEPLKPMNCDCLKKLHHSAKDDRHEIPFSSNTHNNHKSDCISHSQSRLHSNSEKNNTLTKIPQCNKVYNTSYVGYNQSKFSTVSNQNKAVNKNTSHISAERSSQDNEVLGQNKIVRSDALLENLLDEDNCVDEFDDLLGNLDEQSFMEDL